MSNEVEIVKRGSMLKNHREYIVIKFDEDTEVKYIIEKFAKDYEPSWASSLRDDDGKVLKILYKRDKPLKSLKGLRHPSDYL
jgi:hypothetical protein